MQCSSLQIHSPQHSVRVRLSCLPHNPHVAQQMRLQVLPTGLLVGLFLGHRSPLKARSRIDGSRAPLQYAASSEEETDTLGQAHGGWA